MGTIVERKRADGTKTFTAQILRKKGGTILHREAETFTGRKLAEKWITKREAALDQPDGLDLATSPNPLFKLVIDRFLADCKRAYGTTQQNLFKNIREDSKLADMRCSDIRAADIVAFGKELFEGGRSKSTVGGYISAFGTVFSMAKAAWKFRVDPAQYDEALIVLRKLELIGPSGKRDRRPTLAELDKLMTYFHERSVRMHNHGVAPMHRIVAFAIFSTRRLDEIIRQSRSDLDLDHNEMMVRQMKDPRNKSTNDVRCEMTPEAVLIARAMKIDQEQPDLLFPFNTGQVQQAFMKACCDLEIHDLHFHDLRHEGISRLFEMGRTIPQVAAVSAHKNWASLKRYSHLRQSGDKFAGWKWLPLVTSPQFFQIQP